MFFHKKIADFNINNYSLNVYYSPPKRYEKQLAILELTSEDLKYLALFRSEVDQQIDVITETFYKGIMQEQSLIDMINQNSSVNRLKETLKVHITEMFAGRLDENYFEKRKKIAKVHVKIGLKTKWYIAAFQQLLLHLIRMVNSELVHREQRHKTIEAITKIFNLEQQVVLEEYEAFIDALKAEIEESKMKIGSTVIQSSTDLASISERTNASYHELMLQSDEVKTYTMKAMDISFNATDEAQIGKEKISFQLDSMNTIHHSVELITDEICKLEELTQQMESVMGIVTNIANKTNMLALNASIEANRAGAAGNGFNVVANEVRKLAEQTKDSSITVEGLLVNTRQRMQYLIDASTEIKEAVELGTTRMKETTQQFDVVVNALLESKDQNDLVKEKMDYMTDVIALLGKSFEEVKHAAESLVSISHHLKPI